MDISLREKILAPHYKKEERYGDVRYFTGLPLDALEKLIEAGVVEMEPWNECPGVEESFLPFMRRNRDFTAHGYSVSPDRLDCRLTIEGVEKEGRYTEAELVDFAMTFRYADEFTIDDDPDGQYLRCWYD